MKWLMILGCVLTVGCNRTAKESGTEEVPEAVTDESVTHLESRISDLESKLGDLETAAEEAKSEAEVAKRNAEEAKQEADDAERKARQSCQPYGYQSGCGNGG